MTARPKFFCVLVTLCIVGGSFATPQQISIDGARHVQSLLDPASVRRVVMTSSTGVYSQREGEWIDADAPALADNRLDESFCLAGRARAVVLFK